MKFGLMPKGDRNGAYTKPWMRPRGERHGMAKLSIKTVQEMRSLYSNGLSQKEIYIRFGIAKGTAQNILANVTWRCLIP